jgi:hypothetical protein
LPQLKSNILGAIGHDDLEDIVGLYLQQAKGWSIVPSTAKKSNPATEFVLRNHEGKRAYLQVKSGKEKFDYKNAIVPEEVDHFFVFYPSLLDQDKPAEVSNKFINIAADEIDKYVRKNKQTFSKFVQALLDYSTHPPSAPR